MNLPAEEIARLLLKKVSGQLTVEEEELFEQLKAVSDHHKEKIAEYTNLHNIRKELQLYTESERNASDLPVPLTEVVSEFSFGKKSIHRIHFIRKWWWAAAVIVIGSAIAVILSADQQLVVPENASHHRAFSDIQPGSNKAILTLADGRTITLDSAANGQIASQDNVKIVKLVNGEISYTSQGVSGAGITINTMETPRGGQYRLILPDGTRVWLNASSSITYPAVFSGNDRRVKVKGEVYMEVVGNKAKPFFVDVDGQSSIQVLGTSFNINAYADEGKITATLSNGSVKMTVDTNTVILKPGQKAVAAPNGKLEVMAASISQAVAWKNGIFDFTDADLKTVMRQLERWYDIKVEYKKKSSDIVFMGRMYRNASLSSVLNFLQKMDVKFELNGNNLTVL